MSKPCPNVTACPMFPLLSLGSSLKTWQDRYCSGGFQECARYQRTLDGTSVPPDLMPNGVLLRDRKANVA